MKKKLGIILAVVATAVISIVSLVGCGPVKGLPAQIDALLAVKSGQSDIAIIDSTMANYLINVQKSDSVQGLSIATIEGFDDLTVTEDYGVAAQKDKTKLRDFVSYALYQSTQNGIYQSIVDKYELNAVKIDIAKVENFPADWQTQLIKQGEITIAYTDNPPMGIKNNEVITGFDIDLAKAIFEPLGIAVKTKEIVWGSKEMELNSNKVDLVWNGLTITDERKETMAISNPYLQNKQAVVVKTENLSKYTKIADLKGVKIAVEEGSSGQTTADALVKAIKKAK